MKKFSYSFALLNILIFTSLKGQAPANKKSGLPYDRAEQVKVTQMSIDQRKEGWAYKGTNSLLLNQTGFSNWMTGGVNSLALTARGDYDFHFTKSLHLWDSRILLGYGTRSEEKVVTKKVEDIIDLTSIYGYRFKPNWYYAARLNFRTQFSKGYDYDKNPKEKISNFLSPGYLSAGFGFDYRPIVFPKLNETPHS